MGIIDFFKKNKVGAIIAGSYFLVAYYLLDAKKSITGDALGLSATGFGQFAFWIDFAVAVIVGAYLQSFLDKK